MTDESFGNLFRERLNELSDGEKRISLRRMSEDLGHSHSYLDTRYNDPSKVYVKDLIALCEQYDLQIESFLVEDPGRESRQLHQFRILAAALSEAEVDMALGLVEDYIKRKGRV